MPMHRRGRQHAAVDEVLVARALRRLGLREPLIRREPEDRLAARPGVRHPDADAAAAGRPRGAPFATTGGMGSVGGGRDAECRAGARVAPFGGVLARLVDGCLARVGRRRRDAERLVDRAR